MKTISRFVLCTSLLIGASTLAPSTALAQQPTASADAQTRFKRGIELYEEENFAAALLEFRRAYELVPAYGVLYNVARSCYQLRDYTCAQKAFDRYLADGAGQIDARRREEVEKELASIQRRIVTVSLTATKGSTVTVDNNPVGEAPLPGPLHINEGRRVLRATMAGREAVERSVEAVGGDTVAVDLTLKEGAPPPATTYAPTTQNSGPPWLLFGAAGVLLVGAGVTGGLALGASSDAEGIRTKGGSLSDYDSAQSRMRGLSITTDVLGLLAIGVGVTALVMTFTSSKPAKEARFRDLRFTF